VAIPLFDTTDQLEEVRPEVEEAILRVVDSGRFILGPEVAAFEEEFGALIRAKHSIAVANGTAALHVALLANGIGPGDEVIVPSLTAFPTAEAVYNAGATPVYADIDDKFAIDPAHVERLINKKTKGIIPVHLYGQPVDVDAIVSIAGADDYAEVRTLDGSHLVRLTLAEFEKSLDPALFIRVHRSRIVNVDRIARAEPAGGGRLLLHMEDGEIIGASRTGSKRLKDRVL